jgi:YggT family protein
VGFLANLVELALVAFTLLMFGRVLLSWFDPAGRSAAGSFVYAATEPILAPIRRALPRTGAFDLSPLIVLIFLSFLIRLL